VVMDHGHPADMPYANARPRASQSALNQVFTYCEQDEKCHAAYPDIREEWQAVIDRLAKGPVVTSLTASDGTTPVRVDMEGFEYAIYDLLYKAGTYTQIPILIHALATQEDWTSIVKSYAEQHGSGQPEPLLLMREVITCFEPGSLFLPDEIARLNPPSIFRDMDVITAQAEQKICASLPKPDPSLIYPPGRFAPLSALMLNSLLDPIFPPANMDPILKEFTLSRVITEPTEGHDTSASECRWDIVAQYIEQGSVYGIEVSCLQKMKPSFVISD
jgi:hypothetical protein